jgi:ABC-type sugar transport system substrate-binding protein
MIMQEIKKESFMRKLDNKIVVTTESRGVGFATARRNFIKTAGIAASATLLPARLQAKGKETFQNAGPSQAQKALKIVMVPKFTGTAYFAATEKGAKEAVPS